MTPNPNDGVFNEREDWEASESDDGGARSNVDAWRDRIDDDDLDALDAGDGMLEALDFAAFECPWCGEPGETVIDACEFDATNGHHDTTSWVEDCAVCCRPIVFAASLRAGRVRVQVRAEGE